MKHPVKFAQDKPRIFISLVAGLIVILAVMVVLFSRSDPGDVESVTDNKMDVLPEGKRITGWSELDQDSIHIGETVGYQITILFDPTSIAPDFEVFERSVDVTPLEKTEISEQTISMGNNLKKYVLNYRLLAVNVEIDRKYTLDPVLVYFTMTGDSGLKSYMIQSPRLPIVGYYPEDIADIKLHPIKGQINNHTVITRVLLSFSGVLLLGLCIFTAWKFCRKSRFAELSETEKLWLEYQNLNKTNVGIKEGISADEKIFTRLVEVQTGIKPAVFWAGLKPDNDFWKGVIENARKLLRSSYQRAEPGEDELKATEKLLEGTFAYAIVEEKRKILAEPTFIRKLIVQKNIMLISGGCLIGSILMLALSIWPNIWIPINVQHYNELVKDVQTEIYIDEFASRFSDIARNADTGNLKAAAYYNAGTLMADKVVLLTKEQMRILEDLFQSVELDEIIADDSNGFMNALALSVEIFQKAVLELREGVRANNRDEEIRRNLEIVMKRWKAVLKAINALTQTGHVDPVELDELLDLLDSQMAMDFKMEEGKEAPGYYIGEDF